jgi:vitamin B12/bleomycin/antimicrobial peptide transport system ATP-binding/permease protein
MPNATAGEAQLTRETWSRFVTAVRYFVTSEVGGKAIALFAGLLALLFGISGLNVLNSYVGRDFMTAIEQRNRGEFVQQAMLYVGVFGASTAAAVFFRFVEERLGLLWRAWLTGRVVNLYLGDHTYYRLNMTGRLTNPDQRIAEDIRTFVTMTLSLCLMVLNGTLTVLAFSSVLWSISRTLFLVGIAYAMAGSLLTILLGRPLVRLNYRQADREADFRSALIHVGENIEPVALLRREHQLESRLQDRLDAVVANMRRIIGVNRNLGFFTTGYNYMVQIIPALIVAPLFIRGDIEFGVITQSAMAFAHLLGAFSLIITQFQVITSYAAVLARLSALSEAVLPAAPEQRKITAVEDDGRLAYERLTLRAPRDGRVLVQELSAVIPYGSRVLIRSADGAARSALMRATIGIWDEGDGRIVRPPLEQVAFLPERPYLPPGTLRDALGRRDRAEAASTEEVQQVLAALGVEDLVTRAGGLDEERDWDELLSLGEQQLISVARLLLTHPRFVFVDHLGRALDDDQLAVVCDAFSAAGITSVTMADHDADLDGYDAVLDLARDGRWSWKILDGTTTNRADVHGGRT